MQPKWRKTKNKFTKIFDEPGNRWLCGKNSCVFSPYSKFEFSFPVILCLPFEEESSSVFESLRVNWAGVLQWGTQFSPLQKPKPKPDSQFFSRKKKIGMVRIYTKLWALTIKIIKWWKVVGSGVTSLLIKVAIFSLKSPRVPTFFLKSNIK